MIKDKRTFFKNIMKKTNIFSPNIIRSRLMFNTIYNKEKKKKRECTDPIGVR